MWLSYLHLIVKQHLIICKYEEVIDILAWPRIDFCIKTHNGHWQLYYRPGPDASWPFELESGVRVTCDVGYLCANFGFPRPLCSRLIARCTLRDRQTHVRRASSLNAPYQGRGIIKNVVEDIVRGGSRIGRMCQLPVSVGRGKRWSFGYYRKKRSRFRLAWSHPCTDQGETELTRCRQAAATICLSPDLQVVTRYTSCTHMDRSPLLYVHVGLPVQPTCKAWWPWPLTFWPWKWCRVTCDVGYLCANFVLDLGPMYATER